MGIYTNFASTDYSYGDVPERNLFEECGETATYEEMALNLIAESENNYSMIMKAVALDELAYLEESGEEIVYEAGGISGVLTKVKEFFKKLIEKVRQLLHTFMTRLASFTKNDKDFASKYKKEFSTKWGAVKNDFEFKGYVFTLNMAPSNDRDKIKEATRTRMIDDNADFSDAEKTGLKGIIDNGSIAGFIALGVNAEGELKKLVDKLRDNTDTSEEKIRGFVANDLQTILGTKTTVTKDSSLTAAEFSKELFEGFRNGESAKEGIEKSKTSVSEIVGALESSDKMRSAAEKSCNAITKGINDVIKTLDTTEKNLVKISTEKGVSKDTSNIASHVLSIVSILSDGLKFSSNLYVQGKGIYLQALNDRSRQAKAIMVKVIGGSKKLKESYDYDDDNNGYLNEGTSFLSAVNLK